MNATRLLPLLFISVFLLSPDAIAQGTSQFDVRAYSQFLATHQNLSADQLLSLHPAGTFSASINTPGTAIAYWDSINACFQFTPYEKSLLDKHGFVVTDRLQEESFGTGFTHVYQHDLPVFISSDAILHALHMSYDAILMTVEYERLIPKLDTLLTKLHDRLPLLATTYAADTAMRRMLYDLDVYLTVPRILLGANVEPKFFETTTEIQTLINLIHAQHPTSVLLFSNAERTFDFSQFTPRGHYTQSQQLSRYFQAMIWLGRTELYLVPPESDDPIKQTDEDVQRQTIDAVLLKEAAEGANALPLLEEIDSIIRFFVGESDNVTLFNVQTLAQQSGIALARDLLDLGRWHAFQETLKQQSYAFQRINSQILLSDPFSPEQIKPASAFLLLGQRFVVDSYVTGNVVYDRIVYDGTKIRRMLPSTLDVLSALGNDASTVLLQPEVDKYSYASNLAGLRYLVDSYDQTFWQSSLYNGWLDAIRSLNPPRERSVLPEFMQTAAWWQEKMNTQLAAWAQLRHDNLLYAKQSYTGGATCSFPLSYVEPLPQFFDAVKRYAATAAGTFSAPPFNDPWTAQYFSTLHGVADTLGSIALKELSLIPLQESERIFLQTMLYQTSGGCTVVWSGWYPRLFYAMVRESSLMSRNMVVADVHTAPTDEIGTPVGWVVHAGTGPLNMAVVAANVPGRGNTAFIGPVMSYYEHVSTNFKRLTDEEWKSAYNLAPSFRPSFVNLYLADTDGGSRGPGLSLLTSMNGRTPGNEQPASVLLAQNFPNPFNGSTMISFALTGIVQRSHVELSVFNIQGQLVKRLLAGDLSAGAYSVRWDGTNERGITASSGMYFYHLAAGSQHLVRKMCYLK